NDSAHLLYLSRHHIIPMPVAAFRVYCFDPAVACGGYVVAPGSVRENGEVYTIEHDRAIAEIPDWLVTWIRDDVHKFRSETSKLREAEKKKHREAMQTKADGKPLTEYTKDEINIVI